MSLIIIDLFLPNCALNRESLGCRQKTRGRELQEVCYQLHIFCHGTAVAMEMTNGLGRGNAGMGVVLPGEETFEGVIKGSRRNVRE